MTQPLNIQTLEQWVGENEQSIAFALLALRYLEQGNGGSQKSSGYIHNI